MAFEWYSEFETASGLKNSEYKYGYGYEYVSESDHDAANDAERKEENRSKERNGWLSSTRPPSTYYEMQLYLMYEGAENQ